MKQFCSARKRVETLVGESVRINRELQESSRYQLSELAGIPQANIAQANIAAIAKARILGVMRARVLARCSRVSVTRRMGARLHRAGPSSQAAEFSSGVRDAPEEVADPDDAATGVVIPNATLARHSV